MRLICPSCGAIASAEAWVNDPACRMAIDAVVRLPGPVQTRVLPYLALFRQGDRGLSWPRALRLLTDLRDLVEPGTVKWEGAEERPCPHHVWGTALDAVLTRRPKALTSHNYLRHVAWEMASGQAAAAERSRENQARGRPHVGGEPTAVGEAIGPLTPTLSPAAGAREDDAPASDEERAAVAEMMRKFLGKLGGGA